MEPQPVEISFLTPAGSAVTLDAPPDSNELVTDLRRRLSLVLGRHHRQLRLLHNNVELEDGLTLGQALPDAESVIVTVVVQQLSLEALKEFIDVGPNDPTGFHYSSPPYDYSDLVAYVPLSRVHPHDWESSRVSFPEPRGISINMLPFVMGQLESLPEEYRQYWPLIEACQLPEAELGKVGYLTIEEGLVPSGDSQRRPGVHIETPGLILGTDGRYHRHPFMWGCGMIRATRREGETLPKVEGGLYMASNVANSCSVWNTLITDPGVVVGHHGDLEHVRELLGEPTAMAPNRLYWLTDRTPHESLPLQEEAHRQFFRLVTSSLSAWFREHSTANRLGTVPDPQVTTVVEGSKFSEAQPGLRKRSWRVIGTEGSAVFPSRAERAACTRWSGLPCRPYGSIVEGIQEGSLVELSDGSGFMNWADLVAEPAFMEKS